MYDTFKNWIRRWQEPAVWLPLLVVLAVGAWIVFGALDPSATIDVIPRLLDLPLQTAYAIAALALTFLTVRRWRRRLTAEEQQSLWARIVAGDRGALVVYVADAAVWLACFALLLRFFSR